VFIPPFNPDDHVAGRISSDAARPPQMVSRAREEALFAARSCALVSVLTVYIYAN